jgi:hypothetical protein
MARRRCLNSARRSRVFRGIRSSEIVLTLMSPDAAIDFFVDSFLLSENALAGSELPASDR